MMSANTTCGSNVQNMPLEQTPGDLKKSESIQCSDGGQTHTATLCSLYQLRQASSPPPILDISPSLSVSLSRARSLSPFCPPRPLLFPSLVLSLFQASVSKSRKGEGRVRQTHSDKERERGGGGGGSRQDLEFKCTCRK